MSEAALEDTAEGVLVVRRGPGANCSSIGSAVEMLFLSASAGSALLVAVSALLEPDEDDAPKPEAPPETPTDTPPEAAP